MARTSEQASKKAARGGPRHLKCIAKLGSVKRPAALLLAFILWLCALPPITVFAFVAPPSPPRNLTVPEIGYRDEGVGRAWFARFAWDSPIFPVGPPTPAEPFQTFTFVQVARRTGALSVARTVTLPSSATAMDTGIDLSPELESGTIYILSGTASYRHGDMNQNTAASARSGSVKFLTGLQVSAGRVSGTNDIRITWDDVWDTTGRINYRILISETQGFTQPPAIPIIQGKDVGTPVSPVTVNAATGKLEFIWTGASPGREYIIKVVPLPAADVSVARQEEIPHTAPVQTGIILFAQKVGYTDDAAIWRFFWDTIAGDQFSRVEYNLFRKIDNVAASETNIATIPNTNTYLISIPKTDTRVHSFKVEATAYMRDDPAERVYFLSDTYAELRHTIPEKPEAPRFSDFPSAMPPLFFDELVEPTQATLLWLAPMSGIGEPDSDITYDIFLTDSVDEVLDPQPATRIATRVSMTAANEVRDGLTDRLIGYRFVVTGLMPNATHYVSIKANKQYLLPNELGNYVTTVFQSEPSTKVVVTEPGAGAVRPVAPPAPPFAVARTAAGIPAVGLNGMTLQLEKRWHQLYTPASAAEAALGIVGRWNMVSRAEYLANEALPQGSPFKKPAQLVEYPSGWTVIPRALPYADVLARVESIFGRTHVTYSDLSQAFMQQLLLAAPVQARATVPIIPSEQDDQRFTFPLAGLRENTAYLVWITVANALGEQSDASDPLIVTTGSSDPTIVTIPVIPSFIALLSGDSYVDLTWDAVTGMDYEISWGTAEQRQDALGTVRVAEADYTVRGFYRLLDLTPETRYNIWIRAVNTALNATGAAIGIASGWSGAHPVRTEPWKPPAIPTGFGIREGEAGITPTTITYAWVTLPDLEYELEFADNTQFNGSRRIAVSDGEHTVTGLISNRRYFARLRAINPASRLPSAPTHTVIVVTDRSRLDYDASHDLDDRPTGEELLYDAVAADGTWTTRSVGVNAHRLAESIRALGESVVQVDLSKPPTGTRLIRLELGSAVYDALSALQMDLLVRTPSADFTIRPGALQTDRYFRVRADEPEMAVRLDVRSPAAEFRATPEIVLKTPVTDLNVTAGRGDRFYSLSDFVSPLQASLPVERLASYRRDEIKVGTWVSPGRWIGQTSRLDYEEGRVKADISSSAPVAAIVRQAPMPGVSPIGGNSGGAGAGTAAGSVVLPAWVSSPLNSISRAYELHTLRNARWSHAEPVSQERLAKLLLDAIPFDWSNTNPLVNAVRAGFIRAGEATGGNVRREQAIASVVALFAKKSGDSPASVNPSAWGDFVDWGGVDGHYLDAVRFAVENGLVTGNAAGRLNPDAQVTVGELIVLLERALMLSGDL